MAHQFSPVVAARAVEAALAGVGSATRDAVLERFVAAGGSLVLWSPADHQRMRDAVATTEAELDARSPARAGLRLLARQLDVTVEWHTRLASRATRPAAEVRSC